MKKLLAVIAVVGCAMLMAGSAYGGTISGSAHDLSGQAWNTNGELCGVCHTPHNADTAVSDAPLWDHAVTAATYTLYTSSTLDGTAAQPTGVSKLCLSCHDGTVALENFGGVTTGTNLVTGADLVGTDLSDDHPVGINYVDGAGTEMVLISSLSADVPLFSGNVECASCHDVHNTSTVASTPLLRVTNVGSALCLECHAK